MSPIRTILLFLLILSGLTAWAQKLDSTAVIEETIIPPEASGNDPGSALALEIGQLIIDNTFSKAGADFQQIFNTRWSWPVSNSEDFIITIAERPSFLNTTLIEITVNELKVFERFLQPRYDALEEAAAQAIDMASQYILNYEDVVKELNGEDLSGSGIY